MDDPTRQESSTAAQSFGGYPGCPPPQYRRYATRSVYVTARDSTKIAIDVHLPRDLADARIPTIVEATRYWRGARLRWPLGRFIRDDFLDFFTSHGYAVVRVDVRGTGASFGTWQLPYTPDQVLDVGRDVVQWIVDQPWSDGTVGAHGVSYSGNTAAFLPVPNHPAVKAVAPRFIELDQFTNLPFPGGITNVFIRLWNDFNHALDANDAQTALKLHGDPWWQGWIVRGIQPVDADTGGEMLRAALAEHAANGDLTVLAEDVTYRDDVPEGLDLSLNEVSLHGQRTAAEASGAAYFLWASWVDAGTANAVLSHFFSYSNPQRAVIGAWSHGARLSADPFEGKNTPPWPARKDQLAECLRFFDHHLKGIDTGVMSEKILHYYTMGEGWKQTAVWPPEGTTMRRWHLGAEGTLSETPPPDASSSDEYAVDFTATTGTTNRWYTQLGGGAVEYDSRPEQIGKLLSYRSEPLASDTEITGHAVVTLHVRSTLDDGAFFVYLDAEAPDGRIVYLTDGQLRALHRKVSSAEPPYRIWEPYHSFERADGVPLIPGEVAELSFGLQPTSALVPEGWRLRVSIAGHDADNFARIPAQGDPIITVERNSVHASCIDLPVVARP